MEVVGGVLGLTWIIGGFVSLYVYPRRAGLGTVAPSVQGNQGWKLLTFAKMMGWPIVLAIWTARGRPESPWGVDGETFGGAPKIRRARTSQSRTGT